ncbi:chymotrypsin-2-like [Panulirus ornatus]|uniref:chymotrypsin-2-like n=1 Tax=Panulirus ornatus TaxID=150431 RepID=UPI003A83DA8C
MIDIISAKGGCGAAPISLIDSKIVNGVDASLGEYPYQVSVGGFCGGSLISKTWVLTAAHCFTGKESPASLTLRLGSLRLDRQEAGSLTLSARRIIRHEDYNDFTFENDIALIELSQEVTFTDKIRPICLAKNEDIPFGGRVVATGWGTLQLGTSNHPKKLQEVELNMISEDLCKLLASADPSKFICALTPLKDTCQGDSGGPLVANLCPGRWVQVGIVSHGDECAKENAPGVYTRVSTYINWITQKTGPSSC